MYETKTRQNRVLKRTLRVSLLATTWICSGFGLAYANPEGGSVAYGNATIGQSGTTTTINQSSQRAVIDWQSFNVGQNEAVNFIQPGATAIAVNRIHDANPSVILGSLTANGQVMLINQNGVVFGNTASIDVNSLVVSTAMPTEQATADFAHGLRNDLPMTIAGRPDALIYNGGAITARDAGLVGFVSPNIVNDGIIVAHSGHVQLASGSTATLDLYGDGLVDIAVAPDVQSQLIEQRGWIQADGGKVAITAAAGEQIVNSIINMGGVTEARSIEQKNGTIILKGDNSTLNVSGKIDTSGRTFGQKGGTITATAKQIRFKTGAVLDASGDRGGGTIKVGGDYKGLSSLPRAATLTVEQGATIYNDAITQGDGGTTILWSDDHTTFAGSIFARGGAVSGAGGFVETSGKKDLTVTGLVDLSATYGHVGTWLLDPTDITIYNRSQGGTDNTNTFTTSYLETASASASINLNATNNITLNMTGDTLAVASNRNISLTAGNDIVSASNGTVTTSGTGSVSLTAGNNIAFANDLDLTALGTGAVTLTANQTIAYSGSGDITTAGGAITINSDRDATNGGAIYLGPGTAFASNGGNITLGGGANPLVGYAIGTSAYKHGIDSSGANINAGGGNIISHGQGWSDISCVNNCYGTRFSGAVYTTTGMGTITIDGVGGGSGTTTNNSGINIVGASSFTAQNGDIILTGRVSETGAGAVGIGANNLTATTNGTGNISLIDTTGSSTRNAYNFYSSSSTINSGGNVSIIANVLGTPTIYPTITASGDIIVRPYTAGTTVNVGGTGSTLNITDAWLNAMTVGGTLWLGGYGLTGAETGYWNSAGNVTLNTTRSFAKNVNILSGANIVSGAANTLTLTGAASATLRALGDINISHDLDITASGTGSIVEYANGSIVYSGSGDLTTAGGAITINADRDGNASGAISLGTGTVFTSNGGNIILSGGTTGVGYATGLSGYNAGIKLDGATLDASGTSVGGSVYLVGQGWANSTENVAGYNAAAGVAVVNSSLVKTNKAGAINVAGIGGGTSGSLYNNGFYLYGTSSVITQNGDMTINAFGGGGGQSHGVFISAGGNNTLQSTGSGAILATGAATAASSYGISLANGSAAYGVLSTSGDIKLTGTFGGSAVGGIGNTTGTASGTIGGSSATGKISFIADSLAFTNAPLVQTTSDVIIRPYTNSTTVGIGTGAGTLNISDTLLGNITAGTLWLGGYGLTGAETGAWNNSGLVTLNVTRSFAYNVNILSGNNIETSGNGGITTTGAGNINLYSKNWINFYNDLDLTASGTGSITLRAWNAINYSVSSSGDITTNGGTITLNSDADASGTGQIFLGIGTALTSNGGNIVLGGGADPTTTAARGYYSDLYGTGVTLRGATLDASGTSSGGFISIRGQGWANGTGTDPTSNSAEGILINNSVVQTNNSGSIAMNGVGSGTTGSTFGNGIYLYNTSSIISQNGDINLTGTGAAYSGSSGISISGTGNNKIQATGSGNINLTGSATASGDYGVVSNAATASYGVVTNTGNITITGTSSGAIGGIGNSSAVASRFISTSGKISFIADSLAFTNAPLIQTSSDVIVRPYTNSTTVGVGTGTGTLNISDAVLNSITAGTLWLGGYGLTGAETGAWNFSGMLTINTTKSFAYNVNILSGFNIETSGAGGITTTGSGNITAAVKNWINIGQDFDLTANGTGNILLRSDRVINYYASGDITTNGGTITLNSDYDGNGDGHIRLGNGTVLTSNGGNIILGGGATPLSVPSISNYSGFASGITLVGATLDATGISTGGAISLRGQGWSGSTVANDSVNAAHGVFVNNSIIQTNNTGSITINGTSGGTTGSNLNIGFYLYNSSSVIAQNGNITVNGTGTNYTSNHGFAISSTGNNKIQATGTGNINITGAATGASSYGISISNGSVAYGILSNTGNITLTATGTATGLGNIVSVAGTIGGSLASGTISLIGDSQSFTTAPTIQTTGDVIIRPGTVGKTVGIGSGSSNLQVTDSVLNGITAGTLWLGGYGLTGAETGYWNSAGHVTINSTRSFANNVNVLSNANIISAGTNFTGTGNTSFVFKANNQITNGVASSVTTSNGNITLSATNGIVLNQTLGLTSASGNITLSHPITSTVSQTFNSGTGTITASAISVGANDLTLMADDLVLNGNLTGTGILTLQPYSASRIVRVNNGTGDFNLSTAEINQLIDGWSQINIGDAGGSGTTFIGTSTWNDPLNFRKAGTTYIDGTITGLGNASVASSGSVYFRNGAIVTAGQNVNLTGNVTNEGSATITTNGGAVNIGGALRLQYTNTSPTTITTSGGNISINGSVFGIMTSPGRLITLNAGNGTIAFGNTVYGDYDLTATAGAMTFNGAWGASTALGTLSITSTGNLVLPAITAAAGKTVTVNVTGAGNNITASTIAVGTAGNITLTADDLILNGNLSGTGTLTLQPNSTTRFINANYGTADSTNLNLSTAEIAKLVDGWSTINIGRTDSTGDIQIGATTWTDPVNFRTGSTRKVVFGNITGTGNTSFAFQGGWVDLKADITTSGQSVTTSGMVYGYNGTVTTNGGAVSIGAARIMGTAYPSAPGFSVISGNGNISIGQLNEFGGTSAGRALTLNAGTGTIAFGSTVDGNFDLTATGGAITFNGAIGGTTSLGTMTLTSTSGITLPAITLTAGKTFTANVTGSGNIITASTIAVGTAGNITLTADDLILNGNLTGTGTVTLQQNTTSRVAYVNGGTADGTNFNLSTAEIAKLVDGWSAINIGRIDNTSNMNIGTSTWTDPVTFRNNGLINLYDITGTGNASLAFTSNGATNARTDLSGNLTTAGQAIDFSGMYYTFAYGPNTIASNGGSIVFNRIQTHSAGGNLTVTSGGGNITLNNGIFYNSSPSTAKTLSFDAGTGTLNFGSTVNTDLNITGIANAMTFNGAWGATTALGNVTLTSTGSITLPAMTLAAGKTFAATSTGSANSITASTIATGTAGNITLTADDLILNGNLSGTGTLTLQPYSSSRPVYVNFGSANGTNFNLSTAEIARLVDGWSTINIGTANTTSANLEIGASTWTDPVNFRTSYRMQLANDLTGTGNASFNFGSNTSSWFNFNNGVANTITTAGQNVSFTGSIINVNAITMAINTNGGNIVFGSGMNSTVSTPSTVSLNAGTGNVNFVNAQNTVAAGTLNLTLTGNTITATNTIGASAMPLGSLTFNSVNNLSLQNIYANNVTANVTGAGNTLTANAITTGTAGNITLTADDLVLNGNLSGTGTVTLQPYNTDRIVRANNGTGDFNLSTTEIAKLVDGWSQINIGRTDSTVNVFVGTSAWSDPLALRTTKTIYVDGALTGSGNMSYYAQGANFFRNGSVTTAGQSATFGSSVVFERTGAITTNGGAVTINSNISFYTYAAPETGSGTINTNGGNIYVGNGITRSGVNSLDGRVLNLNAGSGTVTLANAANAEIDINITGSTVNLTGGWGALFAIGNLSVTSTGDLILPAITTIAGKTVTATATGSGKSITANAIATGVGGNITLTADDVTLNGDVSGTGTILMKPYNSRSASIAFGTDDGSRFYLTTADIGHLVDGWSLIKLQGFGDTQLGTVNFTDPFALSSYNMGIRNVTGTGNASLAFTSSDIVNIIGNLTTAGQAITFSGGRSGSDQGSSASISSNGGTITFNAPISQWWTQQTRALNIDAGNGSLVFNGGVNAGLDITANANTVTFNGAWGGTTALGNLSITTTNNLILPDITTIAGKAVTINATGAGNTITAGAITTGVGGNTTLTADDLVLNGNLSGTGTLTLQPYSTSRLLNINYGTADGTNLNLSTAEIARLVDGWGQINIGRTNSTGNIEIGASTWADPVAFRTTYRSQINSIDTGLNGTGNASFAFAGGGYVNIFNNITTAGQSVTFGGIVQADRGIISTNGGAVNFASNINISGFTLNAFSVLSGGGAITASSYISQINNTADKNVTFNAGTGALIIGGPVDGAYDLTLAANTMTLGGSIGSSIPLGTLSLTSTGNLILPSIATAAGKTVTVDVTGAGNTITASSIATGTGGNVSLTADDLVLNGNLSGTGTLTLQPYTTTRVVRLNYNSGDFNLSTAELGRLVDGWSTINIGRTNGTGMVWLGTSTWNDPVVFRNVSNAIGIANGQTITGNDSLTFSGGWFDSAGTIATNNKNITVNSMLFSRNGSINTNGGHVSLYGLGSNIDTGTGNLTINTGNGNISFTSGSTSFYDQNTSSAGKTYTLNAGTGTISFAGPNSAGADIIATAGAMTFNGAWGSAAGNITLNSINSLTLPSIRTVSGKTVTVNVSGVGSTITSNIIATGTNGNISLTADDLALNGNLSGTGSLTLQPYNTTRQVNVNYGTADGTNFNLGTTEITQLVDGWSIINIGRSDSSAHQWLGTSSWSDPVVFRTASARHIVSNAVLTGTGNGSFNFANSGNSYIDLIGNVVTNGGAITFGNTIVSYGGNITTNGGTVGTSTLSLINNLSIVTGGGNLTVGQIQNQPSNNPTGKTIILDAGSGSLVFNNAVDTSANLIGSAQSIAFNGAWSGTTPLGTVSLTSASGLVLPSITANNIFVRTTGATSDITLGAGKVLTSSNSGTGITLVAGRNLINNAGNSLVTNNGGRWLAYSTDVTGTTGEDDLATHFNRYSCSYSGGCAAGISVPVAGNGMFYSYTPILVATPLAQTIVYGTTPTLTNYGYALSGYINADDAGNDIVSGSLNGATPYTAGNNIGTYALNYGTGTLMSEMGYGFTYGNRTVGINVTPKELTAALTGTITKTYDQTNTATVDLSNYILTGVFGNDDVVMAGGAMGIYDTINVGSGKLVSVSGGSLSGTKAGNYTLASGSLSGNIGTITPRALTVSGITVDNKTYDGTTAATFNAGNVVLSNLLANDVVALNGGSAVFADKNVGNGITVNLSSFGLTGADAGNYVLTQPSSGSADITPKFLTAALTGTVTRVYDGTTNAAFTDANYLLGNGIISGDTVSLSGSHLGTYDNKNVGESKSVTATGLFLTGAQAGNYVLSSSNVTDTIGAITPKGLTVTAVANQQKTYGAADPGLSYSYTGLAAGDSNATFTGNLQRNTGENVGLYSVNQGTLAATGNYEISAFVDHDFAINKAPITISGPVASRYYGDTNPAFNWSNAVITGLQFGETGAVLDSLSFNVAGSATNTAAAGTTHAITLGGFSDNNYMLNGYTNGSLTVAKAPLIIKANDQTRLYIMPPVPPTATFIGLRNGDTKSVVSNLQLLSTAGAGASPGSYAITAGNGTATNYVITYVPGTLIITGGSLPTTSDVSQVTVIEKSSVMSTKNTNQSQSDGSDMQNILTVPWDYSNPILSLQSNNPLVTFTPELKNILGIGL